MSKDWILQLSYPDYSVIDQEIKDCYVLKTKNYSSFDAGSALKDISEEYLKTFGDCSISLENGTIKARIYHKVNDQYVLRLGLQTAFPVSMLNNLAFPDGDANYTKETKFIGNSMLVKEIIRINNDIESDDYSEESKTVFLKQIVSLLKEMR